MFKKTIIIILTIVLFGQYVVADFQKVYVVDLKYDNDLIIKESISVTYVYYQEEKYLEERGYLLKIISFDNKVLYSKRFRFPLISAGSALKEWFDEKGKQIYFPTANESGRLDLEEWGRKVQLIMPYFQNGKKIEIYDQKDKKILEIDIGYFANVCGDNVCQEHESYVDCKQDCPSGSKDDFCDRVSDGICDPDCGESNDLDCKDQQSLFKRFNFKYIIGSILILLVFLFLFNKIRKRKTELPKQKGTQKIQMQQIKQQPKQSDEKAALLEALKRIKEKHKF
ncbi:hypothetical protein HYX19_04635 [Candidatus Woesearchaeota archaeon]|nr:hypothetical protein [Candidatus Woesearchaeota archaeon]